MPNLLLTALIGVVAVVGSIFPKTGLWDKLPLNFGSTNFPSSLDSLTNPGATDSVATVSHSAQHSNANDAIEAIQAKVGIGASTAVSNSLFAGTGAGTSAFVTWATTTSLSIGSATTSNLLVTASTTLQELTFTNATGTSATTTNSFSTTASSSKLYSTTFFGGSLSSCSGANFLQWTSGSFNCTSPSGGITTFATTSLQQLATTTIPASSFPTSDNIIVRFIAPNVVGSGDITNANVLFAFNYATDPVGNAYATSRLAGATQGQATDAPYITGILSGGDAARTVRLMSFNMTNLSGTTKFGSDWSSWALSTTSAAMSLGNNLRAGLFVWATTTKATSMDIWWDKENIFFGTSTRIEVIGY